MLPQSTARRWKPSSCRIRSACSRPLLRRWNNFCPRNTRITRNNSNHFRVIRVFRGLPSDPMPNIIEMPKLSDTMTVGTLIKWLKNEGDAVKSGDMLAEVETDKATMELESFFDGTLLKIFAPG